MLVNAKTIPATALHASELQAKPASIKVDVAEAGTPIHLISFKESSRPARDGVRVVADPGRGQCLAEKVRGGDDKESSGRRLGTGDAVCRRLGTLGACGTGQPRSTGNPPLSAAARLHRSLVTLATSFRSAHDPPSAGTLHGSRPLPAPLHDPVLCTRGGAMAWPVDLLRHGLHCRVRRRGRGAGESVCAGVCAGRPAWCAPTPGGSRRTSSSRPAALQARSPWCRTPRAKSISFPHLSNGPKLCPQIWLTCRGRSPASSAIPRAT